MKFPVSALKTFWPMVFIGALLVASLASHWSFAGEQEIETTGGASAGKWRYAEIDPTDALLEIDLDGRRIVSVSAGCLTSAPTGQI